MKPVGFVLLTEGDCWRIARVTGKDAEVRIVLIEPDGDQSATVRLAADELESMGYRGGGICLAINSEMVFTDQVDCNNLPRKDRASAMTFRLEEHLPLAAEQFTAAFGPPCGARALGVAVRTEEVQSLIDRLDEAGIEVASICPTALLAIWRYARGTSRLGDYAVLLGKRRAEIFGFSGEAQPLTWSTSAIQPERLIGALEAEMLATAPEDARPTVRFFGEPPTQTADALNEVRDMEVIQSDRSSTVEAAAFGGAALLAGRAAGWVDLRCGDLAPLNPWRKLSGLANLAALLAVTVLAATSAMFLWRSSRYESISTTCRQQQQDQYASLYPGRRAPVSVVSALRSELKRISGISGAGGGMPLRTNALDSLRSIIASLPKAIRLRIVDLRITPTSVFIEGQVRDHTGAELICRSVRRAGFDMDPPGTEHLSRGGVSFTLTGKPKTSDPQIASTTEGGGQ